MLSSGTFAVLLTFLLIIIGYRWKTIARRPLPPGPKKWPIFGSLFQMPSGFEWETYAQWSEIYGSDVIYCDVAGTSIVLVNSYKAAVELLEKRSTIYSSRAWFTMFHELIGWDWLFCFMAYGNPWKERRRLFHEHFNPSDTAVHQPREVEYTHAMLRRLLASPEKFMDHIRHTVGAIIISLAYGIETQPSNDPFIEIAEQALIGLAAAALPGAFLVDSIPILKYVPEWMPGAGFKRKARMWNEWTRKMLEVPFAEAQRQIAEGKAKESFVSMCLNTLTEHRDPEYRLKVVKETAGNFFVGGSDTTVSSINTFILAMVCYPDIQKKAQEELDRVLAEGQLPGFSDEPSLPYVSAIVKEVLRWQTVTPLGVPHYLTKDDEYNGFHLPAGSIVSGNSWAILHDKDEYPEPYDFNPERFLKDEILNPNIREPTAAFGFGRRICPAMHIATSTLWIAAASILFTFDLTNALDADNIPIPPRKEYISSIIMHPAPFECSIKPRSKESEHLILSTDKF